MANESTVADLPRATLERSDAPPAWGGVPLRNPDFTGRETLLLNLQRALETQPGATVLPHALHGLGGVGKTQLAVEFVYRFADHYDLIWWIPAEQQPSVLRSLADLSRHLGIPATTDVVQAASSAIRALGTTSLRWLLVYDNANDPDDLIHLIPPAGGHVILTSRHQTWSDAWDPIEVNVFDRAESIALIQKRGTDVTVKDADRLADKFGDLPLALDQAASRQTATRMPVTDYLDLVEVAPAVEGEPTSPPETISVRAKSDGILAATGAPYLVPAIPEIYVSYKWGGEAEAMVELIDLALEQHGLPIRRDKHEIPYRGSIQDFMRRLGSAEFVIVVLDDAYLRSPNCMFELTELAAREGFDRRVFPIVLGNAHIFDAFGRLGYVKYWETQRAKLEAEMREVPLDLLAGIREDLELYAKVGSMVARITDVLRDMNTLTVTEHVGNDFVLLINSIREEHARSLGSGQR